MNVEIADRLIKLRKEKGLSQEELADRLGVSRQAVSKWERAAASPDTDNLITLAKLYGISLDELLRTSDDETSTFRQETVNNEDTKEELSHKKEFKFEKGGIHIIDENSEVHVGTHEVHIIDGKSEINVDKDAIKEYTKNHKKFLAIYGIVNGVLAALITVTYILLGVYVEGGWEIGWNLYFLLPIVSSLISAIKDKKLCNFAFPVLVTNIYLLVGLLAGIWHPTWVLFILIPVFYSIAGVIDKHNKTTKNLTELVIEHNNENED